ncbi:glycoside hydrolase 15 protein [Microsporum canis]|uniref:Glucoamylase n=1 Tax=Arthroderma otae (strain ATCC MYA-4605 / CBS 113480) TaxID=554155 RepID=C5FUG4_ARTOC|nr:glucoamylase [Microsporum canis CBS 113480]EEQ33548.1 glucoamylase [Microsporum canis CBS 113480]
MRLTSRLWSSLLVFPAVIAFQARFRTPAEFVLDTVDDGTLQSMLDNIGLNGSNAWDTRPGLVIASPSRRDPDYFFTWTRDSALVLKYIVDAFAAGNTGLQGAIQEYISSQARIQLLNTRSGGLSSGGLGEPKYQVDETPYMEDWGRPQADGPALRATAMIEYARWLLANGYYDVAKSIVWPVVKNDLSYISERWNTSAFDLWEEVNGPSFFTTIVQHRALVEGGNMARALDETCPHCESQAPQVLCYLQSYWTGTAVRSNYGQGRSGLDVASILGSIHTFDPEGECDDTTFQPCSARALANHKAVTDSFRTIYKINGGIKQGQAVAVGRYPEDVYFNGNPWYVATYAAAEQLYDAIHQWNKVGKITVTEVSMPFFKDIYPQVQMGTHQSSSSEFGNIISVVKGYAEGYIEVAKKYTPCTGMLSEQFSRDNGLPLSVSDLTWSYASYLTVMARRNSVVPSSWGEKNARELPSICMPSSARGPYQAATITYWPPNLTPTAEPSPCPTALPTKNNVRFKLLATTQFGEDVFLVGSIKELGSWDVKKAVPLNSDIYADNCHQWYADVELPTAVAFEYKFIRKRGGEVVWEQDPNRKYTVPQTCGVSGSTKRDTWR